MGSLSAVDRSLLFSVSALKRIDTCADPLLALSHARARLQPREERHRVLRIGPRALEGVCELHERLPGRGALRLTARR